MPLYEYRCKKCDKQFEFLILSATEEQYAAHSLCDSCGGPLEKVISLSSFKLKGFGWAKDSYGGKKVEVEDE